MGELSENLRKFGQQWPQLSDKCKECGRGYGVHFGPNCYPLGSVGPDPRDSSIDVVREMGR